MSDQCLFGQLRDLVARLSLQLCVSRVLSSALCRAVRVVDDAMRVASVATLRLLVRVLAAVAAQSPVRLVHRWRDLTMGCVVQLWLHVPLAPCLWLPL